MAVPQRLQEESSMYTRNLTCQNPIRVKTWAQYAEIKKHWLENDDLDSDTYNKKQWDILDIRSTADTNDLYAGRHYGWYYKSGGDGTFDDEDAIRAWPMGPINSFYWSKSSSKVPRNGYNNMTHHSISRWIDELDGDSEHGWREANFTYAPLPQCHDCRNPKYWDEMAGIRAWPQHWLPELDHADHEEAIFEWMDSVEEAWNQPLRSTTGVEKVLRAALGRNEAAEMTMLLQQFAVGQEAIGVAVNVVQAALRRAKVREIARHCVAWVTGNKRDVDAGNDALSRRLVHGIYVYGKKPKPM